MNVQDHVPVPPRNPVGLRDLILDTLVFSDYDTYFAEYAAREGIKAYVVMLAEVTQTQAEAIPNPNVPFSWTYHLKPQVPPPMVNLPSLHLSDLALFSLLFITDGALNPMFELVYKAVLAHEEASITYLLKSLLPINEVAREFGKHLHGFLPEGYPVDQHNFMGYMHDISQLISNNVTGLVDTANALYQQPTQPFRNPNLLN